MKCYLSLCLQSRWASFISAFLPGSFAQQLRHPVSCRAPFLLGGFSGPASKDACPYRTRVATTATPGTQCGDPVIPWCRPEPLAPCVRLAKGVCLDPLMPGWGVGTGAVMALSLVYCLLPENLLWSQELSPRLRRSQTKNKTKQNQNQPANKLM